jgi:glycosyltransferase involved in cell wall biosynthesis
MLPFLPETARTRPFRIAAYPPHVAQLENPYFTLFHAALAKHGICVSDDLEIDPRWLRSRAGQLDAVHLHWPENIWRQQRDFGRLSRPARALRAGRRFWDLYRFLRVARGLGIQRIWTVHNLEPHEGAYRWDRYGYRLLAYESDLVVCHSRSAIESVLQRDRPRGRVILMPMGAQAGTYPSPRPRGDVLAQLGLDPDLPVVASLGRLRWYKGLDLACAAIERLHGRVQLIVGGPRHAGFDLTPIQQAVERTRGIVLIARKLSDQEFSDFMSASDAVLLPYRQITGSAALLTALGFGRGVVASDLPYFREILAEQSDASAIVASSDPGAWADSIIAFLSRPVETRQRAALRLADRYSWDRCVEPMVAAVNMPECRV